MSHYTLFLNYFQLPSNYFRQIVYILIDISNRVSWDVVIGNDGDIRAHDLAKNHLAVLVISVTHHFPAPLPHSKGSTGTYLIIGLL